MKHLINLYRDFQKYQKLCWSTIQVERSLQSIVLFLKSHPFLMVSALTIMLVWSLWLLLLGPNVALANFKDHWAIALTMLFGSMVAGGTSMGGGAVAFPVLTKLLNIPAHDAKVFSLAIQTIGMGAASLTIIAMRTSLQWSFISFASIGGILGVWLGSVIFAPILPPDVIRFSFTMMISSFAVVLLLLNKGNAARNLIVNMWSYESKYIAILTGLAGGIISGLVGTGMDICTFSVMVVLFNLCEKISTPTSVILMAINAAVGFFIHQFIIGDFVVSIQQYWFAAIPVVVVGAPAGAIICSFLSRQIIVKILVVLIGFELSSSLFLIPLSNSLISLGLLIFIAFSLTYYWMYRAKLT